MAVYVVATYDIADPKAYEPYVPQVVPLLAKYGAEILVADFGARALEGTARSGDRRRPLRKRGGGDGVLRRSGVRAGEADSHRFHREYEHGACA